MKNIIIITFIILGFISSGDAFASKKDDAERAIYAANILIQVAERSDSQSLAAYELKTARDNYNQAQIEFDARNWKMAEIEAKKSQRDSEVADSKSQALKAEKSLNELQTVVETLRRELKRMGESK